MLWVGTHVCFRRKLLGIISYYFVCLQLFLGEILALVNAARIREGLTAATAHSYSLHNDEVTSGSNFRKRATALQEWTLLYLLSLDMALLLLPGGQALSF